jgi:hypothetical protein
MRTKHASTLLAVAVASTLFSASTFAATASITSIDDVAVGTLPHIALGADGNPIIAYAHPNATGGEDVRVMFCADNACQLRTPVDVALTYAVDAVRVASGPTGPVVVHRDFNETATGSTLGISVCGDATCTDPARTTTIATLPVEAFGTSIGLVIGTDGAPIVSFFGGDGLYVAKCADASCAKGEITTTRVASGDFTGFDSDIGIAPGTFSTTRGGDLPVVAYATMDGGTGAGSLNLLHCADIACTRVASDAIVDQGTWTGWDVSMTSGTKSPALSYFANGTLRVNEKGTTTTIDGTQTTGLHSSIGRGADGALAMGYHRSADANGVIVEDVWFARCAASGCASGVQPVQIDSAGRTMRPVLAIPADDLPILAYIEAESGALTIAKCGTRDCR